MICFPTMNARFTFSEERRFQKVFQIMENLAVNENSLGVYFKNALKEFEEATIQEKIRMCRYLLEIYNDTKTDCITLEEAVIFSAYSAF